MLNSPMVVDDMSSRADSNTSRVGTRAILSLRKRTLRDGHEGTVGGKTASDDPTRETVHERPVRSEQDPACRAPADNLAHMDRYLHMPSRAMSNLKRLLKGHAPRVSKRKGTTDRGSPVFTPGSSLE